MLAIESLFPKGEELDGVASRLRDSFKEGSPFPHIVLDDFFDERVLEAVLNEFPDLSDLSSKRFSNPREVKLQGRGERFFRENTKAFMRFLNSEVFLRFLQRLTGVEETLVGDPYFLGGGQHETKRGGFLKVHADFNKHELLALDRRLNVLIYLNKDWLANWGGALELWPASMQAREKEILPLFNRMVIFSTTDYSFHGVPDPVKCPEDVSRKSLALYYYSNGRPASEVNKLAGSHGTIFKARRGVGSDALAVSAVFDPRRVIRNLLPAFILNRIRSFRRGRSSD